LALHPYKRFGIRAAKLNKKEEKYQVVNGRNTAADKVEVRGHIFRDRG
jgi:hypothetical protein